MIKLSFQLLLLFSFISIQIWALPQKHVTPSFPKVDKEPLSAIPDNAIVLYEDWLMKESVIIGNDGHKISLPGYRTENWYPTTVPTTVLGTLWDLTNSNKDSLNIKINNFDVAFEGQNAYLNFSASQPEDKGSRITTLPVKLTIDGKLYRYLSVGVKNGLKTSRKVTLTGLTPGKHRIQLGDLSKVINYSNKQ